jgi:8-oxo-dGTP pyrophosphatase MutT (NUDIX family)
LGEASRGAAEHHDRGGRALPAFHANSRRLTSETAPGPHPNCRPRDAATLIVIDDSGGAPKLLMGKRHHGHKFMPGKFVFPGGRVEPRDYMAAGHLSLPVTVSAKLLRSLHGVPHPRRAGALVHAALRETREETGIVLSLAASLPGNVPDPLHGPLAFIARAITPPGRPRRFDTRFLALKATNIVERLAIVDGEFSAVHWLTLPEARDADLPLITRIVLDELEERMAAGVFDDPSRPVPFFFKKGACFHRLLL